MDIENRFVRYYPDLAAALNSTAAALILERVAVISDNGQRWFYQSVQQFADELCLPRQTTEEALSLLATIPLIERERRGVPPVYHYRLLPDQFREWWAKNGVGQSLLAFKWSPSDRSNGQKVTIQKGTFCPTTIDKTIDHSNESASASESAPENFDRFLASDAGKAAYDLLARQGISNSKGMIHRILCKFWERGLSFTDVSCAISEVVGIYRAARGSIRNYPGFLIKCLLEGDLRAMQPVAARSDGERARQMCEMR